MTKTDITDEMVERACAAGRYGTGRVMMRIMLDAALNPPAEPEIVVTEAMKAAGRQVFMQPSADPFGEEWVTIYRAMERVRRAGMMVGNPGFTGGGRHKVYNRPGDDVIYGHRRKGDPA